RRRHTISKRDWSSDVCSSDLPPKDGLFVMRLREWIPSTIHFQSSPPVCSLFSYVHQRVFLHLLVSSMHDQIFQFRQCDFPHIIFVSVFPICPIFQKRLSQKCNP